MYIIFIYISLKYIYFDTYILLNMTYWSCALEWGGELISGNEIYQKNYFQPDQRNNCSEHIRHSYYR